MRGKGRILPLACGLRSCCPAGALLLPLVGRASAARADADGANQASGLAVLPAVREQQLRLAGCAQAEVGHVGRGDSGALELPPVGEREVEMQLRADGLAMSRRARRKEQQRIA